VFEVAALPAEAVAQAFDGHAQLLEDAVLAKACGGHFHELIDLDRLAAAMRAQRQAEGRRAFALARAGVHR
jgi:2-methylisocitrate lyase-like PEP mutase family enzyme